jgi:GntR family transcriptional regulator
MARSPKGHTTTSAAATAAARSHLYSTLADDLRKRVASGEFREGMLLPSEASMCAAYGVSRPTVKRALDMLRSEGVIDARRGFGWFVAGTLFRQHLGALSTIEDSVRELGMTAARRVLEFAFVAAPPDVFAVLGCKTVLRTKRINLADGRPVACVTTWCSEELGAGLSKTDVEQHSLYDLLPVEIAGARQVIRAVAASSEDAALLNVRAGSPCLASERITFDGAGTPVLTAVAVFPGHSSEYVAEMPGAGRSGRAGIRVVTDGRVDRPSLLAAHR